jgi:mannose-6-phosphate isomerase class I
MSFMFTPHPYTDPKAVNPITLDPLLTGQVTRQTPATGRVIAERIRQIVNRQGRAVIGLDGYISAPLAHLSGVIAVACADLGLTARLVDARSVFWPEAVLTAKLAPYLPEDREIDPVLLFGSLYREGYAGLIDPAALARLQGELADFAAGGQGALIVYGQAALTTGLIDGYDLRVYLDMTQKQTILNFRSGRCCNIGSSRFATINEMLRRAYYVDFEAAGELRGHLIRHDLLDYYVTGDQPERMQLMPLAILKQIFTVLVTYPFRCRPVYIEGVWGGSYIKRLRRLPDEMRNCAWVFDLIPMEVSLAIVANGLELEFPFYCFVQTVGATLLGETAARQFGGYFPIRFNYDDTFHSSGNMSIQVHPPEAYVVSQNDELGRQDESYYIVATGQKAKTYIGFRDDADPEEFIAKARQAERFGEPLDHDQYVHSVPSRPGLQFMLPAGTIHSSGRNQVVLEIGSLTIGSYTYKMYDYMRKDLEGKLRPIHTHHGDQVLNRNIRASWVEENLVQHPRVIRQGDGWQERIVGEHDLLYFSLRNLEFDKRIEDATTDRFHVLALVDGEQVMIRSLTDPSRYFIQDYLEMVVIPASFGPYEIINRGVGTVVVHKTLLKDGYERDAN